MTSAPVAAGVCTLVCGLLVAAPATGIAQSTDVDAEDSRPAPPPDPPDDEPTDRNSAIALGPIELAMFVDAYASWQTSGKGTIATRSGHRAFSGQGANGRAENGLGLAFLGLDAQFDAGSFGVVASLRFGPAASVFHEQNDGDSDFSFGIDNLTQAYLLYRPVDQLELDLGMFMSPFGFEALESWKNPNYTISALYVYGQPNWHMGLKGTWEIRPDVSVMALVVNGANNISETQQNGGLDQTPTLGAAVSWEVDPAVSLALGGFAAVDPHRNDDSGFDGFMDFVTTVDLGALTGAVNVDYIFTRDGAPNGSNRHFIGGSLTGAYRLSNMFGVAARGEYLHDQADFDGHSTWQLLTGTLTLDVHPLPRLPYFVVRWENRWERSNQRVFGNDSKGTRDPEDDSYGKTWFESVVGAVVTTAP